jgi:hypothetical protein
MTIKLQQVGEVSSGDTEIVSIDYTDWLDAGESLDGTPTAVEVTSTDLTIEDLGGTANQATVSTGELVILGATVAAGAAVSFVVSGQVHGSSYQVLVTATTDATPARTVARVACFNCV